MEYAQLGEQTISRIGFGCAPMGGFDYGAVDDDVSIDAVHAALDAGVNFFDVADIYGFGHAEEVLGRALQSRRNDAVIATKFGLVQRDGSVVRDASAAHVAEAVDRSLRRLGIDCIDLYQLHWPDPQTSLEVTAAALESCRKAGKIRMIGCCNMTAADVAAFHAIAPVASVQVAYNLLCRAAEADLFDWCRANGVKLLAHSTLARGFLAGRANEFSGTDTRVRSRYFETNDAGEALRGEIRRVAEARGVTAANVAVRWALQRGADCALVGVRDRTQLEEHAGVGGWSLTSAELRALDDASAACPGAMTGELAL
jgi:aryl-alcohol dehydrogenase-like predicted oxidoreductase